MTDEKLAEQTINPDATPVAWMTPCGVVASEAEKSRNIGRALRSSLTIPLYLRPEPDATPAGGQYEISAAGDALAAPSYKKDTAE